MGAGGRLTPRFTDTADTQAYGPIYAVLDADTGQFVDFFTDAFDSATEPYGFDLNYFYYIQSQSYRFTPEVPIISTSPALPAGTITMVNNFAGTSDIVTVVGLLPGDIIKVYRQAAGVSLLGTANVTDGTSAIVEIAQFGTGAGQTYVSLTRPDMLESARTLKTYGPETLPNTAPVANAGADRTYEATAPNGRAVVLDGTGSSDPDGNPLTWTWSGSFGTAIRATPTVQLPLDRHTITLTVSDGKLSSTDVVVITIQDTTPPALTLPANITIEATSAAGEVAPSTHRRRTPSIALLP